MLDIRLQQILNTRSQPILRAKSPQRDRRWLSRRARFHVLRVSVRVIAPGPQIRTRKLNWLLPYPSAGVELVSCPNRAPPCYFSDDACCHWFVSEAFFTGRHNKCRL